MNSLRTAPGDHANVRYSVVLLPSASGNQDNAHESKSLLIDGGNSKPVLLDRDRLMLSRCGRLGLLLLSP